MPARLIPPAAITTALLLGGLVATALVGGASVVLIGLAIASGVTASVTWLAFRASDEDTATPALPASPPVARVASDSVPLADRARVFDTPIEGIPIPASVDRRVGDRRVEVLARPVPPAEATAAQTLSERVAASRIVPPGPPKATPIEALDDIDPADEWALEETGEVTALPPATPQRKDEPISGDWEWNLATGEVRTGPRWRRLVGDTTDADEPHGPDEILGRLDSGSREVLLAELTRSLGRPDEQRDVELGVQGGEGERLRVHLSLRATVDPAGERSRVSAWLRDADVKPTAGTAQTSKIRPVVDARETRRTRAEREARERMRRRPDTASEPLHVETGLTNPEQTIPDGRAPDSDSTEVSLGTLDATAPPVRPPARGSDRVSDDVAFATWVARDGALFDHALTAAGLAVATLDRDREVRLTTASLDQLVRDWPNVHAWWRDVVSAIGDGWGAQPNHTLTLTPREGATRVFAISISHDGERGVAVARDVSDLAAAEASRQESERRYALAAEIAHAGLWDWDLRTGTVDYSPRWAETLGLEQRAVRNTPEAWFGRVHPDDVRALRAAVDLHMAGHSPHFEHESRMLHGDGSYRWTLARGIVVRDETGRPVRVAGSLSDISGRKRAEARLAHGSTHDALTNLPNRNRFLEMLALHLDAEAAAKGVGCAILVLDLDRLKLVNEGRGHRAGDALLSSFARRLRDGVREEDVVARLGGDEFAVLVANCDDVNEAQVVAERIQESLAQAFELPDGKTYMSASVGIAMSSPAYDAPEDLVRDAETAMSRAKALGRARHVVFDPSMHRRSRSLLALDTDLRHAVDRAELELHYQPIIDLKSGRVSGFEALVRWRHHERGLVWPEEFIPLAEENGQIEAISEWVLREACRQLAEWGAGQSREIGVSVNLSSRSFERRDLVAFVKRVLKETGVPAHLLRLEVTETVLMDDGIAGSVLAELRALGVKLYLDDFGTGYSSLSYLQRFDVDALKIDRSFVAQMHTDQQPSEIVVAITSLAHNLGLEVIAEGVQTPDQMRRLREIGCEYGQGYLFARPLDAAYAEALLDEDPRWR